jgi:predicted transcriptional regulator
MDVVLTDREATLMDVLWDHGASTVAEVQEGLSDPLAYTTVLTILRTLEQKGYVTRHEEGRAHRYAACVPRDVARASAVKALSEKLFSGSAELLLTHLVSDRKLTRSQLERMQKILDERSRKQKP